MVPSCTVGWIGYSAGVDRHAFGANRLPGERLHAAVLFLVGMFAGRLEMVLSGLVMPTGPKAEGQPPFVSYWPTIWEVFVFVFALAVLLLVYTLGERHLKLSETSE